LLTICTVACGSSGNGDPPADAGVDAIALGDAAPPEVTPPLDASKPQADGGGFPVCDSGSVLAVDRFATRVVSFTPGDCGGFGAAQMPTIVLGPPAGAGDGEGSFDVVSLGERGAIVVSVEPNAIVDGPGTDFIVFENAFNATGNPQNPSAELGEVSVSDDGVTWTTFPCTATKYPYGTCAGWHPVYANPDNCLSPVDPKVAGGDPFDLADVGLARARFVRIVDRSSGDCPANPSQRLTTNGFDLDAIAVVNAEKP
jgi:hypothetical protein